MKYLQSFIVGALAFSLMIPSLSFANNDVVFADLNKGHHNYLAVKYLNDAGIISGYGNDDLPSFRKFFKPENKINRAEAVSMVIRTIYGPKLEGLEEFGDEAEDDVIDQPMFTDVNQDDWFFRYIDIAHDLEIINGYEDGTFKPNQVVNRAEMIAILTRALAIDVDPEGRWSDVSSVKANLFVDVKPTDWYAANFEYVKKNNLLNVTRSNKVNPVKELTRSDAAELIYRFLFHSLGANFGSASFYADRFDGRNTASGRVFRQNEPTAAHLTLPFGTKLEVVNLATGDSVIVEVQDRGPYGHSGRVLDLSKSAFESIAPVSRGYVYVQYKIVD